jgi:hypothetical protein
VDPSYCPLTYTFDITELSNSETAVTEDAQNEREIDIFWIENTNPLGQTQTVTLTVTSKSKYTTNNTPRTMNSDLVVSF